MAQGRSEIFVGTDDNSLQEYPRLPEGVEFDSKIFPNYLLHINVYLSNSWRKYFKSKAKKQAKAVVTHASGILKDSSLNTKIVLEVGGYHNISHDFNISGRSLKNWSKKVPKNQRRRGTVHIVLVASKDNPKGIGHKREVCSKDNSKSSAIVRWLNNPLKERGNLFQEIGSF